LVALPTKTVYNVIKKKLVGALPCCSELKKPQHFSAQLGATVKPPRANACFSDPLVGCKIALGGTSRLVCALHRCALRAVTAGVRGGVYSRGVQRGVYRGTPALPLPCSCLPLPVCPCRLPAACRSVNQLGQVRSGQSARSG